MLRASRQHVNHSISFTTPLCPSARKRSCYCIKCAKKLKEPLIDEPEIKSHVCEKLEERVIMNDGPWKPRTVEEEIDEHMACKVKENSNEAEGDTQKTESSTSEINENTNEAEGDTQKTESSTSEIKENSNKAEGNTQKTENSALKVKRSRSIQISLSIT